MKTNTLQLLSLIISAKINEFKKVLASFLLIISISSSFAQSPETELFTLIPELNLLKVPAHVQAKLEELKRNKAFKSVRPVTLGNLARIQKNGILTFAIPGSGKFTFYMNRVEADSESDYKWIGRSSDGLHTAIFISEKGMVYGSFNTDNRSFQVYTINGTSFLMENNNDVLKTCSTDNIPESIGSIIPKSNRKDNCNEAVRVLVVYTQKASNAVTNIGQTINQSIEQFNTAIDNSGIGSQQTNKIILAGTQLVTFPSTADPEAPNTSTNDAVGYVRDNTNIQSLRNQYQADLVVCLTDDVYGNTVGHSANIPASNSDYCAIVVSTYSDRLGQATFTHEMGHLLGGRHQSDSGGPSYSHGYKFVTNPPAPFDPSVSRTMMHVTELGSSQILYFSNPNVSYVGSVTGNTSTNNVARRIGEVSPTVADFRSTTNPSFNGYIQGPGNIGNSGSYQWELIYSCRNLTNIEWRYSTDGFNFGSPIGSSEILNYNLSSSNNGLFYLKCTVTTSNNETFSVTQYVSVNICSGCRLLSENIKSIEDNDIQLYPNPGQTRIMIDYFLENSSEVEMGVFDLMGKAIVSKSLGIIDPGKKRFELDVANWENGKYTLKLLAGNKVLSKVFVVSK